MADGQKNNIKDLCLVLCNMEKIGKKFKILLQPEMALKSDHMPKSFLTNYRKLVIIKNQKKIKRISNFYKWTKMSHLLKITIS